MQFYLAPLEGVTGHVFREAYDRYFHDVDKYFTPFLSANDHLNFKTKRELGLIEQDVPDQPDRDPDRDRSQALSTVPLHAPLVPQILSNHAEQTIALIDEIASVRKIDEINLNFGCPSGTVTGKNRGAGIFKDLVAMDDYLDRLFAGIGPGGRGSRAKNDKNEPETPSRGVKISLKTRIGWADENEWEKIVRIYADYPFSEIIIHPRVRADQYSKPCRTEAFAYALSHLDVPLCYNGEIHTVEEYKQLCKLFPTLDRVRLGRGIVKNPFLIRDIRRAGENHAEHTGIGHADMNGCAGTASNDMGRT
ncbi:MAG: tRNA-dihydrouridine synthase family protein, partial [Lachnospiraceae bacterium]|nr:tRNA-dihydrouridine synthase family protein [Lachnospiraceae bacterium]